MFIIFSSCKISNNKIIDLVKENNLEALRTLNRFSISYPSDLFSNPLFIAYKCKNIEAFTILLDLGYDPNIKGPHSESLLKMAFEDNEKKYFNELYERNTDKSIYVNRNDQYLPLLFFLAEDGEDKKLVDLQSSVDYKLTDSEGNNILHYIVARCSVDTVKLFFDTAENKSPKNNRNETDLIDLLVGYGNNPSDIGKYSSVPIEALYNAETTGKYGLVKQLYTHIGNYNEAINNDGDTALIYAAESEDIELSIFLLENGADPSIKTKAGLTAADYYGVVEEHRRDAALLNEQKVKYKELLNKYKK